MKKIRLSVVILLVAMFICLIGKTNSQAELTVYDADGQLLGVLIDKDVSETVNVYLQSLDVIAGINVKDGFLKTTIRGPIYFNSFDCTDTPYISPIATYYAVGNGDKYYMGDKSAPYNININSRLELDGSTCKSYSADIDLVPAQEVITPFSLPVALPLIIEHEAAHPGKWKK